MIRRTFDAALLNRVANHPDVRRFLGGPEGADDLSPLDLTAVVENPANIALVTDHGGWIFHQIMAGTYEVHTMFEPAGRGRKHLAAARVALRYVFGSTDCLEILTKCPDDNGPARWASSTLGFRERFRRDNAWAPGVGVSYRVFSVDDWFVRDEGCLEQGRRFHVELEAAKSLAGSELAVHPEDEAHDRAVGAAVLMIQMGQPAKGVGFYNRWAAFAGYAPIGMLSPTVFDVGDAIVAVLGGEMTVLKVRGVSPP